MLISGVNKRNSFHKLLRVNSKEIRLENSQEGIT